MRLLPTDHKSLAPLDRGLIATTALTALIVAAIGFAGLQNKSDEAWVNHSLSIRAGLLSVLSLVQDAETAQRGYLLTGRSLYLAPYRAAFDELPQKLDQLGALISDNPQQSQALDQLRRLAGEKLDELRSTIEEEAAGHHDAALSMLNSDTGFN